MTCSLREYYMIQRPFVALHDLSHTQDSILIKELGNCANRLTVEEIARSGCSGWIARGPEPWMDVCSAAV